MAHYYSEKQDDVKTEEKTLVYAFGDKTFEFISDHGVFSKGHIDGATDLLLKTIEPKKHMREGLDLGCGYGVIGIVLDKTTNLDMTMIDVNQRAIELSRKNVGLNDSSANVFKKNVLTGLERMYDLIVSNPPIRIGKQQLYEIFTEALDHLTPDGEFWFVMHKKHGALSALKFLRQKTDIDIIKRHKGFHVFVCRNH